MCVDTKGGKILQSEGFPGVALIFTGEGEKIGQRRRAPHGQCELCFGAEESLTMNT